MRRIDTLRTLAIGSALILAIGTTACASDEESDEMGEAAPVEATMSTKASEGTADETSPAEEEKKKTSEAEAE